MRRILRITMGAALCIALSSITSCSKDKDKQGGGEAQPPATTPTADEQAKAAAAKKAQAEADAEKQKEIEKVAERIAKYKAQAAEDAKRWTDEIKTAAAELIAKDYADARAALTAILASPHRTPANVERDKYRHPLETLLFFGVRPDMTVVEVGAGGGWYTEVLAPLLAKNGKLVVAGYDAKGPPESSLTAYGVRYALFLEQSKDLYGKVEVTPVEPPDKLTLGPAGSADMALAIREMHNWHRRGYFPQYVKSVFEVLKPGGVFGVVQHRAPEGANPDDSAENGRLPEKWLIEQLEGVGFKFEGASDVNNNPKDTKDYEKGVWTLPPGFALEDTDREKYAAIGESDRMTLKFVKPVAE
jgi:predicted methyltransferase